MRKIFVLLVSSFFLVLLTSCIVRNEDFEIVEQGDGSERHTGIGQLEPDDEEIVDFLSELEPIPFLMRHHPEWIDDRWTDEEIYLIDLLTGEILATHKFERYQMVGWWELNGYYAVELWEIDENLFDVEHKIVILDNTLNLVDIIYHDTKIIPGFVSGFLKFEYGNLYAYVTESDEQFPGEIMNPLRVNLHTSEVETLAEINDFIQTMHRFVGENQIFVTDYVVIFDQGRMSTRYGVLDIDTGSVHYLVKENFAFGHLDFIDGKVLISEGLPVGPPLLNEVILFNLETLLSETVQLKSGESNWAYFSYDGNSIVTVNQEENLFRKYDFNGKLMMEIDIYLPSTISGLDEFSEEALTYSSDIAYSFQIFSVTEEVYLVLTTSYIWVSGIFLSDQHIQIIVLP